MNETLTLATAGVAGGLLGGVFFGGLWWTIRKAVSARRPALWFLGSLLVRMTVALGGLGLVSGLRWERLLPCLFGFFAAAPVVARLTRLSGDKDKPSGRGDPPCTLAPTR
jgi:F1F0 ATPase subunit 2